MAYKVIQNRDEAIEQLKTLISAFREQHAYFRSKNYSEAQLRIDFLNPLLKTFGWDVDNEKGRTQFVRDVIQEESIDVAKEDKVTKKNPDYTLRIGGNRKLFIEAKKASIDILNSKEAAFQVKRYGWNAALGVSILTNFEKIVLYDCRQSPNIEDDPHKARYRVFNFEEYIDRFDELYEFLSQDSIRSGILNDYFALNEKDTCTFDEYFLEQIEGWRENLAADIVKNNGDLEEEEVNFLVQRLLNRIIFLRICEDREIEKYETLKKIKTYDELKDLFKKSDRKYNSGLFDFIEDNFSMKIKLDEKILIDIFAELYYPTSPYDFAVIEPNVLSQIYEKYLASRVVLLGNNLVKVEEEPEVAASNGVIPTPKLVVDRIVRETLEPVVNRKGDHWIEDLRVADICCGSGTFLISIFDFLAERRTEQLAAVGKPDEARVIQAPDNTWHLTLKAKQEILLNNIFGVDINPYAAEVSRFSLLLKLLEGESSGSIDFHLTTYKEKVLPDLSDNVKSGNSLVDDDYFEFDGDAMDDDDLLNSLKPFDWVEEYPFLGETGGFDAIVGNPPYVRIQNMVKYLGAEVRYYQSKESPFTVGAKDIFDKYYLFIERALQLTSSKGIVGYIVPHKFFIIKGGKKLRALITKNSSLHRIIHFGVTQVFPGRSTYTAILIMDKNPEKCLKFQRISRLTEDQLENAPTVEYSVDNYGSDPWTFLSKDADALFDKIRSGNVVSLGDIAEICVGLQTSADKIYIIHPLKEKDGKVYFKQDGNNWKIEKNILKPAIYDGKFNLFGKPKPNASIIFPYKISDEKAEVFTVKEMQSQFPLCWKYLRNHQTNLEKRDIGGGKTPKWYQYGRSQSLTKFHNTEKLIWPVLSVGPNYALDDDSIQFTGGGNGPYYSLIPSGNYSIYYILAVISHPVIEAMVKSRASEFRGAYYSHGKQFISSLPIRKINWSSRKERGLHDRISSMSKAVVAARVKFDDARLPAQRKVLGRKVVRLIAGLVEAVSELYGITNDDIISIEGNGLFLAETTEEEQD